MSEYYFESSPETEEEKEQALFLAFDTVMGSNSPPDDQGEQIGELYGMALEEGFSMEDIDRIYEEARDKEV